MNPDIYVAYVDAAQKHGAASIGGDHVAANKAHSLLMKALKEIRMQPDRGAEKLTQLLHSSDSFVVCWAATHLLPLNEGVATTALRSLSENEPELAAFTAKMVLQEWEAGRLIVE